MGDASDRLKKGLSELMGNAATGDQRRSESSSDCQPALRLHVEHLAGEGARVREYEVSAKGASIGRADSCDIVLAHDEVSGLHAEILFDGEAFYIIDQSLNGTFKNIEAPEARLATGRAYQIEVGPQYLIADYALTATELMAGPQGGESQAFEPGQSHTGDDTVSRGTDNISEEDPFEAIRRMKERVGSS